MPAGCAGGNEAEERTCSRWTRGWSSRPRKSTALVALDEALQELAVFDPRKAQVVEMRYFGGMSVEETAAVLDVHPTTVKNDWRMAKMWLKSAINPKGAHGG